MAQKIAKYVNPVLNALKKLGGSARPTEVFSEVIKDLGLEGSAELEERKKDGILKFHSKFGFVRYHLVRAGYIDQSNRGVWSLTEKGRSAPVLTEKQIHEMLLDVQRQVKSSGTYQKKYSEEDELQEEPNYREELLAILKSLPPKGFEQICQRLLRESGFEKVEVTGRTGDKGIDGIGVLKVNAFVSFKVLFQCKRYAKTVGVEAIRDFRGAMQSRADKGIFLTTGTFTADAIAESDRDGAHPIELVDAERLLSLFESLELGLKPRVTYDIDKSFFDDYQVGINKS